MTYSDYDSVYHLIMVISVVIPNRKNYEKQRHIFMIFPRKASLKNRPLNT